MVTELTATLATQISQFLETQTGFHYFQSPDFFAVCHSSKKLTPYFIIASENDTIAGVLCCFRQVQIAAPVLAFLSSRTIIWGGPVVANNKPEIMAGLLQFHQQNGPKTVYTQVRNLADTNDSRAEFVKCSFHYCDHLTILVDLRQSEAELWNNVYPKRKNQIRRAEKEGCIVEKQDSISALKASYSILKEVYERARLPLPDFGHFESLHRQANAHSGLRLFTVSWDGQLIGCMLCLAYRNWLFDYYAGAYSQYYKKYPNDLLPWQVFTWAKKNGFTHFDFGGAGKPNVPYGVRDYKKQFGGKLVCFGRYEKVSYPCVFSLANTALGLWQRFRK